MKRRDFLKLLGGVPFLAVLPVKAKSPGILTRQDYQGLTKGYTFGSEDKSTYWIRTPDRA